MMLLTTISFVTYAKTFLKYVRNDSILVSWSCYFILDWFLITLEFWTIVIQGKMPKNNAILFLRKKKVKWSESRKKIYCSSQKTGFLVGSTKASFLSGKKLRLKKYTTPTAARSVTVCVAADPDRPLWFPGSTPPPWLDGRSVKDLCFSPKPLLLSFH